MDNPYVHGLRQHDARPRAPIVVPNHMQSTLTRRKIVFESMLLEERALHEHSADNATGGYDGGGGEVNFSYDNEITYEGNDLLFEGGNLTFAH
jgi:hypothetical protein